MGAGARRGRVGAKVAAAVEEAAPSRVPVCPRAAVAVAGREVPPSSGAATPPVLPSHAPPWLAQLGPPSAVPWLPTADAVPIVQPVRFLIPPRTGRADAPGPIVRDAPLVLHKRPTTQTEIARPTGAMPAVVPPLAGALGAPAPRQETVNKTVSLRAGT